VQGQEAPVIVWEVSTRKQVYNLFGITIGVKHLAFSPDERFLTAVGEDNMLFLWDMQVRCFIS
jgi:WD40 repeat protein